MKNKVVLPGCPYCGAKLGYLETFVVKNRSTYKCRSCGNRSAVDLKRVFYNILWIVLVISVVVFIFATLAGGGFALFGAGLIVLVFAGFYGVSPYVVTLKKAKKKVKIEKESKKKKEKVKYEEEYKKKCAEDACAVQKDKGEFSDRDIFSN